MDSAGLISMNRIAVKSFGCLMAPTSTRLYNASIDEDSKLYYDYDSEITIITGYASQNLGGEDLVAFECFVEVIGMFLHVAVTLHKDENGMSPVFYRNFYPTYRR